MKNGIFRVALVGCGTVSGNHLNALAENPATEIIALCDLLPEKAQEAAKKYAPAAEIFTDYLTMLDTVRPDVVHICTPHYLHCPMTLEALRRDIHVFLEKPMAISEDEIGQMLTAEKESRGKVCVCFQNRFNPSTVYAEKLAAEDGGVLSAYGALFWNRDEAYYKNGAWRGKYATEGGGVMINQAIHTIDLLCRYLGEPVSVCATTANHRLKGIIEVEDTCEGVITFKSEKKANFYATNSHPGASHTEVMLETAHHTIEIRSPYVYVDGNVVTECEKKTGYIGKECYGNGHKYLITRFYEALATGAPVPVPAESARHAVDILLAAYASHDTETPVKHE